MLIITRREGEKIIIGDQIVITIVRVKAGEVRIGVTAPPEVRVDREEVRAQLDAQKMAKPIK